MKKERELLISIITPNFNSQDYIEESYHSILNQGYTNWEWLIIDDGSHDDSPTKILEWAEKDQRIKFFKRESKLKGASVCRNIGIEKSKGDYLLFLDADDILESFCLEQREWVMRQNPSLDFSVFKMGYFKSRIGDTIGYVNIFNEAIEDYLKSFLSYNIPWAITCPIWRRDFLIENNIRFSEKFQRLQDPEFHTKILLKHKPNFEVIEQSRIDCYYRQAPTSKDKIKVQSFNNITNGFHLLLDDTLGILKDLNIENSYTKELSQFVYESIYTLLFQYRLSASTNISSYIKAIKKLGIEIPFRQTYIKLFYFLNKTGLTFIKGAGVSRLWSFLLNR